MIRDFLSKHKTECGAYALVLTLCFSLFVIYDAFSGTAALFLIPGTLLIFWSLVRNSVVLAVYLLFSVACFLTVHEHSGRDSPNANFAMISSKREISRPRFIASL